MYTHERSSEGGGTIRKTYLIVLAAVLAVTSLFIQSAVAGAPVTGAIFTTLEDGTRVNANHYDDKRDVYLDGGPGPNAPQEAAGLPDGNYYFQVTDPSGKKLLSQDAVKCKEFKVEDGVISEYLSIGRTYTSKGKTYDCYKDGWEYGMHDLGWDEDHDAVTIQLMPYKNTPNHGGVYKAWATPTEDFDGDPEKIDNGYSPGYFHGFIPRYSKTDNYKVKAEKPSPELELCKFRDVNNNGEWDTEEPAIAGWAFYVTDPLDVQNTYYSGEDGCVVLSGLPDGYYDIEEELPEGWEVTATEVNGSPVTPTTTVTIQVKAKASLDYSVTFGNVICFTVDGYKYDDKLGDGDWDEGDTGIEGWTITIYMKVSGDWEYYDETTTDSDGYYSFKICDVGEFKAVEETREGWEATSPTEYTFTAEGGETFTYDFFNYELGKICGLKWYDLNKNKEQDGSEVIIEGFKIELYKNSDLFATDYTDENGEYCFENLGPGDYMVKEVMPNDPGDDWMWLQTYPEGGFWVFEALMSGTDVDDADFGNVVEFRRGLQWCYWRYYNGLYGFPRDPTYDLLPDNPMEVDVETPDGDYLVENEQEADWIFSGAGGGEPSCEGDCRSLFRVQLLALHMNMLKYPDMASAVYLFSGDPYSGMTVQQIYNAAIDMLTDGEVHDFSDFRVTLSTMNYNGGMDPGKHVLVMKDPPTPDYS